MDTSLNRTGLRFGPVELVEVWVEIGEFVGAGSWNFRTPLGYGSTRYSNCLGNLGLSAATAAKETQYGVCLHDWDDNYGIHHLQSKVYIISANLG